MGDVEMLKNGKDLFKLAAGVAVLGVGLSVVQSVKGWFK